MAWGHFAAGSLPGAYHRGRSQLLKGDLNLAVKLPHVQKEGDMVAVMLNDVVVHVDQDSGRQEEVWLDWGRPRIFRASEGQGGQRWLLSVRCLHHFRCLMDFLSDRP